MRGVPSTGRPVQTFPNTDLVSGSPRQRPSRSPSTAKGGGGSTTCLLPPAEVRRRGRRAARACPPRPVCLRVNTHKTDSGPDWPRGGGGGELSERLAVVPLTPAAEGGTVCPLSDAAVPRLVCSASLDSFTRFAFSESWAKVETAHHLDWSPTPLAQVHAKTERSHHTALRRGAGTSRDGGESRGRRGETSEKGPSLSSPPLKVHLWPPGRSSPSLPLSRGNFAADRFRALSQCGGGVLTSSRQGQHSVRTLDFCR